MDDDGLLGFVFITIVLLFLAVMFTCISWTSWRPGVSEWREVTVPHQAEPISVPAQITWRGVHYKCVLVQEETP